MGGLTRFLAGLICVFVSLCLLMVKVVRTDDLNWEFEGSQYNFTVPDGQQPKFVQVLDYERLDGNAHSPSIALTEAGFSVFWFDGTRESANDVVILQAPISQEGGEWRAGKVELLFDRHDLETVSQPRQSILTLGNVIPGDPGGEHYFATIVSFGGWAAASIAKVEYEQGELSHVEKLSLSPFLNRSHLVRAPAVAYADGTLGLPAYFELGKGFGEWVRLDHGNKVRAKSRMNREVEAIQAVVVPYGPQEAVALSRNFEAATDRLVANWTEDGGRTWSGDTLLENVPNPNAPVAALLLSNGDMLMTFNDSANDASILKLGLSSDQGRTWQRIYTLESGAGDARYPTLMRLPTGEIALTYSVNSKRGIHAYVFNEAWVRSL